MIASGKCMHACLALAVPGMMLLRVGHQGRIAAVLRLTVLAEGMHDTVVRVSRGNVH